jgi:periplasmic copper chaperone A
MLFFYPRAACIIVYSVFLKIMHSYHMKDSLMRQLLFIAALVSLPLALALPSPPLAAHENEPGYRKGEIHAIQAWARINPAPGRASAVYLVLHNEGKVPDRLVAASSPIAGRVEIHEHIKENNVMRMRPKAGGIEVKPDDLALLEPGGLHLMLLDVKTPPKAGTRFPLTLQFAKGKPQTIQVSAYALNSMGPKKDGAPQHGHHHGKH